ncbi:MAG: FUSC family protein [Synechococcaceae cyanobacterium]|nr:FUSC family protein [Synechococcaceae cyanobacterium]
MLITRSDLRLALIASLANGLGVISGLPFGIYAPIAVLAVCSGSFGNTLDLGRQRLVGSVLGELVLVAGLLGFRSLPLPLAMGCTLGGMRLIGGMLGLKAGYKVGGIIIVMGWLVHQEQLGSWLPLRLFWTTVGILMATLSLELVWPARAIDACEASMARLLGSLSQALQQASAQLLSPAAAAGDPALPLSGIQTLIGDLAAIRRQLPEVERELGANPQRHPRRRLLALLENGSSVLINLLESLARQPLGLGADPALAPLRRVEAELLAELGQRLEGWSALLRSAAKEACLRPPPLRDPAAGARRLETLLQQPDLPGQQLEALQLHAGLLSLIGLAERAVADTERRWRELSAAD